MIYYFINMTPSEFFWCIFVGIVIFAAIVMMITCICDLIADHIDRKREEQRRLCKRLGIPVRPTRRY